MSTPFDVIVVGAGVGGLSAAMRLGRAGARVVVLERGSRGGGKLRATQMQGRAIDVGPTVLTMRHVFDDLFEHCGLNFNDFVDLEPLEILARHAWCDGSRLDLFSSVDRTARAIERFAGAKEANGYRDFCEHTARLYQRTESPFIGSPKRSVMQTVRKAGLGSSLGFMRVDWHRSMWRALGDFFRDPRLRQLFGRYATYYGSSPFAAPATLNLIAHVEQRGVWRARGGMRAVGRALVSGAQASGAKIAYGCQVSRLLTERGRVCGVRLCDGSEVRARTVISNADPQALATGRFGPDATHAVSVSDAPRSLSAITFAWLAQTNDFPLEYHNVFFSEDYQAEFDALFDRKQVPNEPTVYVCAPQTPPGETTQGMFALINAPATGDRQDFSERIDQWRDITLRQMERCGLSIGQIVSESVTTPNEFARRFPATGGALYGPATHTAFSAFERPGTTTKIPGLYLVGGGVHPGAGVPMVALGGRWAAEAALADLRTTFEFRQAATAGGISTATAPTASMQ